MLMLVTQKIGSGESPEKEDSGITSEKEGRIDGCDQSVMVDSDPLLGVEEVAARIRFSPKSIYQLVHRKKIPYTKISGGLRFRKSDIEAWIAENTFKPQAEKKKSGRIDRPRAKQASGPSTDVDRMVEESRGKYLET